MKKISVLICLGLFLFQCNSDGERFIFTEAFSESVSTSGATTPCEDDSCLNVNESAFESDSENGSATASNEGESGLNGDTVETDTVVENSVSVDSIEPTDNPVDIDPTSHPETTETLDDAATPPVVTVDPNQLPGHDDIIVQEVDTDSDTDGIADEEDNCPSVSNADQKNQNEDEDFLGDVCDYVNDADFDGLADAIDTNVTVANDWFYVNPDFDGMIYRIYDESISYTFVAASSKKLASTSTALSAQFSKTTGALFGGIRVRGVVDSTLATGTEAVCPGDDQEQLGICIISKKTFFQMNPSEIHISQPVKTYEKERSFPEIKVQQTPNPFPSPKPESKN